MPMRMLALFRGINVGRAKPVDMTRLRAVLAALGYDDIATYLRSGNAVFSCSERAAKTAASDIEEAVANEFGFESRVVTRTARELDDAIKRDPLTDMATDGSRHFVGFLSAAPSPKLSAKLIGGDFGPNRIAITGRHAYLWCPEGLMASPFGKMNMDRELGVVYTARNWNTVGKLSELL